MPSTRTRCLVGHVPHPGYYLPHSSGDNGNVDFDNEMSFEDLQWFTSLLYSSPSSVPEAQASVRCPPRVRMWSCQHLDLRSKRLIRVLNAFIAHSLVVGSVNGNPGGSVCSTSIGLLVARRLLSKLPLPLSQCLGTLGNSVMEGLIVEDSGVVEFHELKKKKKKEEEEEREKWDQVLQWQILEGYHFESPTDELCGS
ncbi:unnamed protein product [Mesocestoides corti]|uniref:Uncharacterized protein n=2 Tax=Mesocestoides corti TaxID=53468 RepID=A0A0R3U6L7_MESCO|nr:unnamed protein product [Mesocestoides corti]